MSYHGRRWPFLVLFGAAVFCLWRIPSSDVLNSGDGFGEMLPNGEAFLHHTPTSGISYRMPLASVVLAWHHGHSPQWAKPLLQGMLWSAPVFVAFQAGCLLQSPAAGALSALAAAAPLAMNETGMGEEIIYRLLVGLVVVLLIWRTSLPDLGRSLALGLGIGLSLLCRSPLLLLPMFLVFYDIQIRRPRGRWGPSLALICASFVPLIPWVVLNWRLDGRFIPFENGRGDCNMTTGALGIVSTIAGNYRELAGVSESQAVLPWAVRQIMLHPLHYIEGCLGRLWFVFRLQPFLCLTAAAFLWIHRRREVYRQLGLFCGYFIGMHCLLSIEKRYLEPVWIFLAILSLSGAVALLPFFRERESSGGLRWFFWPHLGAGVAAGFLSLYCLWTYPTDALLPRTQIGRAFDFNLQDAWLLHMESRELLRIGKGPWAVDRARTALRLEQEQYVFLFSYVWALTTEGGATHKWMDQITTDINPFSGNYRDKTCDGYLLKTIWRLAADDESGAAKAYEAALEQEQNRMPLLKRIETPSEHKVEDRLRQIDKRRVKKIRELLNAWPFPTRAVLASRMMKLADSQRMRLELTPLLSDDPNASRPLEMADGFPDAAARTHREAMGHQQEGQYGRALQLLSGLVSAYPNNAKLRSDRGIAYALLGRRDDAIRDLESAIGIDPYYPCAYLSLGSILTSSKQYKKALAIYEAALRRDCFKTDPGTCASIRAERDRIRRLMASPAETLH